MSIVQCKSINSIKIHCRFQAPVEEFRTTHATIRLVDPPNVIGRAPSFQGTQSQVQNQPILPTPQPQQPSVSHPNTLVRDFKPSMKLPDDFMHTIGSNMILNPADLSVEVMKPANSMKKMVFPESSEESSKLRTGLN